MRLEELGGVSDADRRGLSQSKSTQQAPSLQVSAYQPSSIQKSALQPSNYSPQKSILKKSPEKRPADQSPFQQSSSSNNKQLRFASSEDRTRQAKRAILTGETNALADSQNNSSRRAHKNQELQNKVSELEKEAQRLLSRQELVTNSGKKEYFSANKSQVSVPSTQASTAQKRALRSNSAQKYDNLRASLRGQVAQLKQQREGGADLPLGGNSLSVSKLISSQRKQSSSIQKSAANQRTPSSYSRVEIAQERSSSKKRPATASQRKANDPYYPNPPAHLSQSQLEENIYPANLTPLKNQLRSASKSQSGTNSVSNKKREGFEYLTIKQKTCNSELLELIQRIIFYEKRVERAKQDLAIRCDFNLLDAFRYIDQEGRGIISSKHLEQFLKELGIQTSITEIYLLMRKFDTDNDGKLR